MATRLRTFSLLRYVDAALAIAEYERDENDVIVAVVPDASGFFTQGETFEQARANLRNVIEGNVLLALQLGLPIPRIPSVIINEAEYAS